MQIAADILAGFTFGNGKSTRNRIALAPMTNLQSNRDGTLGAAELAWLTRCAEGGFGLILTCATHVSLAGQGWVGELGSFDDRLVPGLHVLASAVKDAGSLALLQISHAGSRAPAAITGRQPVSASQFVLDIPGFEVPRAIAVAEIDEVVSDFAAATRRAHEAGFDGVNLHGANGYILTQFLSTVTNHRTDEYGGDLRGRARLVVECLRACREAVPDDFLVTVRLSTQGAGLSIPETVQVAGWLVEEGADLIGLAQRPGVAEVREVIPDCPIMAGGGIWTPADAQNYLQQGADFAFLGSAAIGNQDWPLHVATGDREPVRAPYPLEYLHSVGITDEFIDYIRTLPPAMGLLATD